MIATPSVQWSAISPELILFGCGCLLLLLGSLIEGRGARRMSAAIAAIAYIAAGLAALALWHKGDWLVLSGQLRADRLAEIVRIIVASSGVLAVAISVGTRRLDERISEYYALLLFAGGGMSLLAAANGLVTVFIALETFSIALYVLCALDVRSAASLESGLKYLVIGSVGSSFLVFGSGLVYIGTTSLRLDRIGAALHAGGSHQTIVLLGIGMITAGLAFKASAAPFHMWTPDVYEGAPTAITAFMAAATKTVALATILRVLTIAFDPASGVWEGAVAAIAIASMAIGNIAALAQTNAKRMLAYSSIGHAGYLLIAVVAHTPLAGRALVYYLAVYSAMNLGAFAVIAVREREIGKPVELSDLAGWGYSRPFLGGALALFLLSLASFPPTGGFLAKLYLFGAAISAGKTYLAVVGVVATMISLGYYLRFGLALYLRPQAGVPPRRPVPGTFMAGFAVVAAGAVVLWLGIAPQPFLVWARDAAASLPL